MMTMNGKRVKDLSIAEREYLEKSISGVYRMNDNGKNKEGRAEVIIDFENGLSVAGWIVCTGDETYYEMNDDAIIYDAGE